MNAIAGEGIEPQQEVRCSHCGHPLGTFGHLRSAAWAPANERPES